ncbi:cytochrome-c peroxidase [Xanthomonas theicola]|nr:cytochrome c peroxidase [Xanthomonas theicola]QNH23541.1 c-type cytochrome [Xanthomonas theicola]
MRFATGRFIANVASSWFLLLILIGCTRDDRKSASREARLVHVGQRIFNDARLGADGRTSCATCHVPRLAFTDGRAVSAGAFGRLGTRNAPSLIGVADRGPQFWDGRESTLARAVMQPFGNPREMGDDSLAPALLRIAAQADYREAFGEHVEEGDVAAALTAYLQSLDDASSPFERAHRAGDFAALGEEAARGLRLFQGKAQCAGCHVPNGGHNAFSDGRYHHASVGFARIAGHIRALHRRVEKAHQAGEPIGPLVLADADVAELGRFAVTADPRDLGAFRTPSLRNVARTAPYMHDGSIQTLEAAIEHELYYRGLASGQPIKLTVEEQRELAAFLRTLSTP